LADLAAIGYCVGPPTRHGRCPPFTAGFRLSVGTQARCETVADGREIGQGGGAFDNADASAAAARKPGAGCGRSRCRREQGGPLKKFGRIALYGRARYPSADDAVRGSGCGSGCHVHSSPAPISVPRETGDVTPFVAGIDDLDPERDGIEVASLPNRSARRETPAASLERAAR